MIIQENALIFEFYVFEGKHHVFKILQENEAMEKSCI